MTDPTVRLIHTPDRFKTRRQTAFRMISNGQELVLFEAEGPGCVRHLWLTPGVNGRGVRLRIHVDDAPAPQVDMELNHFFGILLGKDPCLVESPGLKVLPRNAYNCYLPIPFGQSCRISVVADRLQGPLQDDKRTFGTGNVDTAAIYFQADWQQYQPGTDPSPYRLHATYRIEEPAQHLGSFLVADLPTPICTNVSATHGGCTTPRVRAARPVARSSSPAMVRQS